MHLDDCGFGLTEAYLLHVDKRNKGSAFGKKVRAMLNETRKCDNPARCRLNAASAAG